MRDHIRFAVRTLAQRPGTSLTIITTLALAIGANSAIFSVVDAAFLRSLPYPAPDRLVSVHEVNHGQRQLTELVAPVRLEEWNRLNRSFAGLAGCYFENVTDTTGTIPERVEAMRTSPRFFEVLGVGAAIGRTFAAEQEVYGGPPAVVVSDAFWRRRLNADPSAIGRALVLSGVGRTIVGVMPASFRFPSATTEAWIPAQMAGAPARERRARFYTAIGRLNAGVTVADARADLSAIQSRLGEQFPDTDKGWSASVVALGDERAEDSRQSLWLLFGAVVLVLLTACGNIACLMLADAMRRDHDTAIRLALGASRPAIVRQLLTEAAILAACGAALGLALADWTTSVLRSAGDQLPALRDVHVDGRVVVFTLCLTAMTTVVFALAPALGATRRTSGTVLSRGGRGYARRPHLLQTLLVSAQIALAIVLLAGAGLLARSFVLLQRISPGFDPANVLTFRMSASWSERPDAVIARQARTIARLEQIPGVEAAAISQILPAGLSVPPSEIHIVGRDPREKTFSQTRPVSAGYFRALRIPILRGSSCDANQTERLMSKALVTRAFADRYFPGVDPIGHSVTEAGFPPDHSMTIIGMVGDVREAGLVHDPEPVIYWCGYSAYWPDPHFLVRLDSTRHVSASAIRAALAEIEPTRAMYGVQPLVDLLAASVFQQRLNTLLLVMFATMGVALSATGLYGVMSQLVAARRREFGVRMALGAQPTRILSSVALQAAVVTGLGIVVGLASALALAKFMATLVFGVAPRDPLTFSLVPLVVAVVGALATLVPAVRAARVDPIEALRED